MDGREGWFVRQSEVTCVLHVNYEEHVPVARLTTEEMDLVSQTVKSSFFTLTLKNKYLLFLFSLGLWFHFIVNSTVMIA